MSKKKLYVQMSLILLVGIIVAGMFGMYLTGQKNMWMYRVTDSLLAEVAEKYPGAEEKVMREILGNGIRKPDDSVLEKYGVEEKAFSQKFDDSHFYINLVVGVAGILLVVCAMELVIVLRYSKSQNQQLQEIERYCEEILNGHYTLDLRDNEEGDFSILKNKVYDITVMLNEKNHYLEENKKDTERLLADISHQLKTPITSLNMINELLYLDLPEEKRQNFWIICRKI